MLDNPYTYTEYRSAATGRRGSRCSASRGLTTYDPDGRDGGSGPDFIEALARGLDMLRCFDARRPIMTLSEIAAAAGLARPTVRRILLTLEELGYVRVERPAASP